MKTQRWAKPHRARAQLSAAPTQPVGEEDRSTVCPQITSKIFTFCLVTAKYLLFRVNLDHFLSLCIPWQNRNQNKKGERKKKKTQITEPLLNSQGSCAPFFPLRERFHVPRSQPGVGSPGEAVGVTQGGTVFSVSGTGPLVATHSIHGWLK